MNIARTPEGFQVPGVAEMNPTGLPELFRHLSNLNNSQKCEKMQFNISQKNQKNSRVLASERRNLLGPIRTLLESFKSAL